MSEAPVWHKIREVLSLPDRFQVTEHGPTHVTLNLRGNIQRGNPCSQLVWNVNGFSSRWRSGENIFDPQLTPEDFQPTPKQNKKKRQYARKCEKADFRTIILRAGSPDLITLIESKLSLSKMISLPGFIQWCENMSYRHISLAWSTGKAKGGAGYAGVMTLSKFQPIATSFDFNNNISEEARVITQEFESFCTCFSLFPLHGL